MTRVLLAMTEFLYTLELNYDDVFRIHLWDCFINENVM